MDFTRRRAQARQKRDDAIASARREYWVTIRTIAASERKAIAKGPDVQQLTKAVDAAIPSSGTFTIDDVMAALAVDDPDRCWPRRQVVSHMGKLTRRGVICRLRRSTTGTAAIYSATVSRNEPRLLDVVAKVLGGKSLKLTELTVRVIEAGYAGRMTPKVLRGWIATRMRRSGRFRSDNGKWKGI